MDPGLSQAVQVDLRLDSIPVAALGTRRRRRAQGVVLVHHNFFLELDDLADAVWRACDGQASVMAIAEAVGAQRPMDFGLALAATVAALAVFAEHGMVTWGDVTPWPGSQ